MVKKITVTNRTMINFLASRAQEEHNQEDAFLLDIMKECLHDLPKFKHIFDLKAKGKSNEEIARKLGVTVSCVKKRWRRGFRELQVGMCRRIGLEKLYLEVEKPLGYEYSVDFLEQKRFELLELLGQAQKR